MLVCWFVGCCCFAAVWLLLLLKCCCLVAAVWLLLVCLVVVLAQAEVNGIIDIMAICSSLLVVYLFVGWLVGCWLLVVGCRLLWLMLSLLFVC